MGASRQEQLLRSLAEGRRRTVTRLSCVGDHHRRMHGPGCARQTQRGSVRLALLCALAGAAAVFVWRSWQPGPTAVPTPSSPARTAQQSPDAAGTADSGAQPFAAPGDPTPRAAAGAIVGNGSSADSTQVDAATHADSDGFSPDYGALVDEFQQRRALEPIVDE
jgi:hypothetical protein